MRFIITALSIMLIGMACRGEEPFQSIDLRSSMTMGFRDAKADDRSGGWTDQGPANDMAPLNSGMLEWNGVPFEIINPAENGGKSCLALRGKYRSYFPLESNVIPVNSPGDMIYFLGTCAWSASIGEDVLRMIVEYDERSAYCDTDFCFGEHIGSWWNPADLPLGDVAWEGANKSALVGLYSFAWKNPYPDETIKSIKFISSDSDAVPVIVAATLVKRSSTSEKLLAGLQRREAQLRNDTEKVASVEVRLDLSKPVRLLPGSLASLSNGKTINPVYIPQGKKLSQAAPVRPFYRIQTHPTEPAVAPGEYDFSALDEVLDYIDALGCEPLLSISKGPEWIGKKSSKRWIPDDVDGYRQYCREIVRHCAARKHPVLWYEIGNEPDLKGWSYKLYIQLFKAVAGDLRTIEPRIKLGGPVSCGPNIGWAKLLVENAGDDVDFVSYHQYGYSEDFSSPDSHIMNRLSLYESSARKYKEMLEAQKQDCLIFLTEANTSWRFPDTDPRIRTQFGAAWAVSAVGNFLLGGGDIFHFFTYNGGFGMTWMQRGENMLFPAYHSYWLMRKYMSGQMIPAEQNQEVVNTYGYLNSSEAGAFVVNITDHAVDVDLQFQNNPMNAEQAVFYILNEQTWQPVRKVSEGGVVPELKPVLGTLSGEGKFTFTLAPYEVRLVRVLNKAEKLELQNEKVNGEAAPAAGKTEAVSTPAANAETFSGADAANRIPNPSAETPSAILRGIPADWSLYPADADGQWDESVCRSGTRSLRIGSSSKRGAFWFSDLAVDVSPGETVELQGYVKTSKGWGDNLIKLVWYDVSGKWISSSYSRAVNGTKDWTELKVEAVAPKGAAVVKVFAGRRYATDKGLSWFDDIRLVKSGEPAAAAKRGRKSSSKPDIAAPFEPPAGNLLPNFSAEQESEIMRNTPAAWSLYPADAEGRWDEAMSRSGGKSLRVDSSGKRGTFWFSDLAVDVNPGETVELQGYVKTSNGWGDNLIKLVWYDASGKWISSSYSRAVNGTKDWMELKVEAPAPKGAAVVKIFVGRRYATDKGLSWFDDITLIRATGGK